MILGTVRRRLRTIKASFVEIALLSETLDEFRVQTKRIMDILQLIYDDEPAGFSLRKAAD